MMCTHNCVQLHFVHSSVRLKIIHGFNIWLESEFHFIAWKRNPSNFDRLNKETTLTRQWWLSIEGEGGRHKERQREKQKGEETAEKTARKRERERKGERQRERQRERQGERQRELGDLPDFLGDFLRQPNAEGDFSGHYKTKISHAFHPSPSIPLSSRPIRCDQHRYPRLFSRQSRFASLAYLKLSDILRTSEVKFTPNNDDVVRIGRLPRAALNMDNGEETGGGAERK